MIYHYCISKKVDSGSYSWDGVYVTDTVVTDMHSYSQLKRNIADLNIDSLPKNSRDYKGWSLQSLTRL